MYSGRYWPAKVLQVNTMDKILVVKYDNDELDYVQHTCIQPLSPFKFGGGLSDNIIENTFFIKKIVDLPVDQTNKRKPVMDFVESEWGINDTLAGNLITCGELCEFRDPRDINSTDPSDFVGYTKELNPEEPLYSCKCIYQDDEHAEVSSCNIRRAVVVKWNNWVYECARAHRLIARNQNNLISKLNVLVESVWVYPRVITSETKLASYPSNMRVDSLQKHRKAIKFDLRNHPGLKGFDDIKSIDNLDRFELIKKCKSFHDELVTAKAKLNIFDFLENECQELRVQVDRYETKIQELESQLLCFICTKSKINCIIHPCGHFQICDM